MNFLLDKKGFSLIEMVVVLIIISILLAIAVPQLSNWLTKYNIEADVKKLYSDLQNARVRATTRNRMHFVQIGGGTAYTITEDTDPPPFGDTVLNPADTNVLTANLSSPITIAGFASPLTFDSRGITNIPQGGGDGAICLTSTVGPDYDCIVIGQARLNMGKLAAGGCNAANCQAK